jgi:hypothetical protein
MLINSDLAAAVAAARQRDIVRAADRHRLVGLARLPRRARPARPVRWARLTRPPRPAEDAGPAPSPAPVALHRPATDRANPVAEQRAQRDSAA